ncbi:alpha/beta hydrolase fold domain-containing protein, partial [Bilophila wadsworthia]|uniref:alpha/beta hydrolase fold domain-containing protein n=1 Tax=Bilophila wadsworthia TaxID=35833 RepID=UPI003A861BAA
MNGGPVQRRKAHRERRPQHFRYGRLIPAADGLRPGAQPSLESVQHFLERGGGLRHGGGWILGDKDTHDRLVRELAKGAKAAVVYPNYTPSPEAQYPVPLE